MLEALSLEDCYEQFALFTMPKSEAATHLPEGFEPVAWDPAGEMTDLEVWGIDCEHEAGSVEILWLTIPVEPPEAYKDEGLASYVVPIQVFVTPSPALEAFQDWGFAQAVEADIETEVTQGTEQTRTGTVEASAGGETVRLETSATGPTETAGEGGGTYRLFGVEDGDVTTAVDATFTGWSLIQSGSMMSENTLLTPLEPASALGCHCWGWSLTLEPAEVPLGGPDA